MSDVFTHAPTITLEVRRCYECGRYWAIERAFSAGGSCPCCARSQINDHFAKRRAAERAVASLRGALTKAKRRGRR